MRSSSTARLACATALLTLGVAAAVAMPSDAQDPTNADSIETGRVVAQKYCARCHAIGRRGASRNPKSPPFRTIVARRRGGHLPGDLFIDGSVVRHPGMPQFELRAFDVDGLIAYIRRIARK